MSVRKNSTKEAGKAKGLVQLNIEKNKEKENKQVKWE